MGSFVNERTVEYLVVPALAEILRSRFPLVIPFYYWASREGSRLSRENGSSGPFRLLSLFARRPKTESLGSEFVDLKVNRELFEKADYLHRNGVPVVAAFPCASCLVDLAPPVRILWFEIKPGNWPTDEYRRFRIAARSSCETRPGDPDTLPRLAPDSIPLYAHENSRQGTWADLLQVISEYRRFEARMYDMAGKWFFVPGYKPVFFLLSDEQELLTSRPSTRYWVSARHY